MQMYFAYGKTAHVYSYVC